jgi:hypothetical protein
MSDFDIVKNTYEVVSVIKNLVDISKYLEEKVRNSQKKDKGQQQRIDPIISSLPVELIEAAKSQAEEESVIRQVNAAIALAYATNKGQRLFCLFGRLQH